MRSREGVFAAVMAFGMAVRPCVQAATVYVDVNSATPVFPYDAWTNAARQISFGVSAAAVGDTVLVTNGLYPLSSTIIVNKAITIQSVNGPATTVIDGKGSGRCLNLYDLACVVSGFTVTNGYCGDESSDGAGIYCAGARPVVTNCVIVGNRCGDCGGGMYNGAAYDCVFTNNTANDDGGGMYGGTAERCTFIGNSARYSGGGMYANGHAVHSCTFSNNAADGGGGLYYGTASNSTFVGNAADQGGGMDYGTAVGCVFHGNTATGFGGGVHDAAAVDCVISNNTALNSGGGMSGGSATNCSVVGNRANTGGGAYGGAIDTCVISSNSASYDGGGMRGALANDCTIVGNTASGNGGGVYEGTVTRCAISANTAVFGGGIWQATANNCLVVSNTADYGGGMCYGTANNCTFSDNAADVTGGGALYGTANNCVLWYNAPRNVTGTVCRFSCASDVAHAANGCTTNEPLFANRPDGNYRVSGASACIDSGTNSYAPGVLDLDRTPRIEGPIVDMGAYEWSPTGDIDGDGMADLWEITHFDTEADCVGTDNPDGDRYSNFEEYVAGTDPNDEASVLLVATAEPTASGFVVTWQPVEGRVYDVLRTPDLNLAFEPLASGIAFPAGSYTDTVHSAESIGFYQLNVRLQE